MWCGESGAIQSALMPQAMAEKIPLVAKMPPGQNQGRRFQGSSLLTLLSPLTNTTRWRSATPVRSLCGARTADPGPPRGNILGRAGLVPLAASPLLYPGAQLCPSSRTVVPFEKGAVTGTVCSSARDKRRVPQGHPQEFPSARRVWVG
ncbi:hypothetical protein NDU88_006498 [Pleurodeles waltl]|uniref:Uncharacterized protein n=1 Tax=Pleurodeles waltl TaxID=8319 RepID=A0AAV7TDN3_PLEWA|nr:hypothetical protein NDU88_006498 [Pleurodeles waltl]